MEVEYFEALQTRMPQLYAPYIPPLSNVLSAVNEDIGSIVQVIRLSY